jgi:hypothetical protein
MRLIILLELENVSIIVNLKEGLNYRLKSSMFLG